MLDTIVKKVGQMDEPGLDAERALLNAMEFAEEEGVESVYLNPARRRLKEVAAKMQKAKVDKAKGKFAQIIGAIDAAAEAAVEDGVAASLLLHVYEAHPPMKPSFDTDYIKTLLDGKAAVSQVKKAYIKAQRDYHPDRNTGNPRDTFGYDPEEWEALCNAICQQLSRTYDRLYKGERDMEG